MILTFALAAAFMAMSLVIGLVVTPRRKRSPLVEVGYLTRSGLDTRGQAWMVRRLDARSVRLYQGAHVHVDACGPATLATLTERYAITWER